MDDGGRTVGRPDARLACPVGLDDVGHDHQQRIGVRCLRGEQRLGRLSQPGLVGQQELPVPGRGRGDHPCLVRHQLQTAGRPDRGRLGQSHAGRGSAPGVLERPEERTEQLPAGQAARLDPGLLGDREVGGEEGVGQLSRDDRLRHDPPLGGDRGSRRLIRCHLLGRRLDAGGSQHVALEQPGRFGDLGVLREQPEQRGVAGGGLGQDRRDPVEALELLCLVDLAAGLVALDARALLADQQCDDLELCAYRRHHGSTLDGRLDLAHSAGEDGDDAVVVAPAGTTLVPRGGTASARLALASLSHRLLLWSARPLAAAGRLPIRDRVAGVIERRPEPACEGRNRDATRSHGSARDRRGGPRRPTPGGNVFDHLSMVGHRPHSGSRRQTSGIARVGAEPIVARLGSSGDLGRDVSPCNTCADREEHPVAVKAPSRCTAGQGPRSRRRHRQRAA